MYLNLDFLQMGVGGDYLNLPRRGSAIASGSKKQWW
jgi:hypothetical protein